MYLFFHSHKVMKAVLQPRQTIKHWYGTGASLAVKGARLGEAVLLSCLS